MKKIIAFLLAAALGICTGLALSIMFQITEVTDNTMLPSFTEGEHVLLSKRAYASGEEPPMGDVVLFSNSVYASTGEGGVMMKRVIAGGGDRVMITDGKVYVNNQEIQEDYVFTEGISGEMDEIMVPSGHVFVLGDNRAESTDSRAVTVGTVEIESILGKVIFQW